MRSRVEEIEEVEEDIKEVQNFTSKTTIQKEQKQEALAKYHHSQHSHHEQHKQEERRLDQQQKNVIRVVERERGNEKEEKGNEPVQLAIKKAIKEAIQETVKETIREHKEAVVRRATDWSNSSTAKTAANSSTLSSSSSMSHTIRTEPGESVIVEVPVQVSVSVSEPIPVPPVRRVAKIRSIPLTHISSLTHSASTSYNTSKSSSTELSSSAAYLYSNITNDTNTVDSAKQAESHDRINSSSSDTSINRSNSYNTNTNSKSSSAGSMRQLQQRARALPPRAPTTTSTNASTRPGARTPITPSNTPIPTPIPVLKDDQMHYENARTPFTQVQAQQQNQEAARTITSMTTRSDIGVHNLSIGVGMDDTQEEEEVEKTLREVAASKQSATNATSFLSRTETELDHFSRNTSDFSSPVVTTGQQHQPSLNQTKEEDDIEEKEEVEELVIREEEDVGEEISKLTRNHSTSSMKAYSTYNNLSSIDADADDATTSVTVLNANTNNEKQKKTNYREEKNNANESEMREDISSVSNRVRYEEEETYAKSLITSKERMEKNDFLKTKVDLSEVEVNSDRPLYIEEKETVNCFDNEHVVDIKFFEKNGDSISSYLEQQEVTAKEQQLLFKGVKKNMYLKREDKEKEKEEDVIREERSILDEETTRRLLQLRRQQYEHKNEQQYTAVQQSYSAAFDTRHQSNTSSSQKWFSIPISYVRTSSFSTANVEIPVNFESSNSRINNISSNRKRDENRLNKSNSNEEAAVFLSESTIVLEDEGDFDLSANFSHFAHELEQVKRAANSGDVSNGGGKLSHIKLLADFQLEQESLMRQHYRHHYSKVVSNRSDSENGGTKQL